MGTIKIKNLSTLTDAAALLRVAAVLGEVEEKGMVKKFEVKIIQKIRAKGTDKEIHEFIVTDYKGITI